MCFDFSNFFVIQEGIFRNVKSRVECLHAIESLLIGLDQSASMKHQEIYKMVKPFLTNNDPKVKSAAAKCVSTLATRYPVLVTVSEVENLFQLSLRQITLSLGNDDIVRIGFSLVQSKLVISLVLNWFSRSLLMKKGLQSAIIMDIFSIKNRTFVRKKSTLFYRVH